MNGKPWKTLDRAQTRDELSEMSPQRTTSGIVVKPHFEVREREWKVMEVLAI